MATKVKLELLVHGFVREIEHCLNDKKIIPLGVINICCAFYSFPFKIFFAENPFNTVYIADIEKKSISNLMGSTDCNKNIQRVNTSCYIPDISSLINISDSNIDTDKCYDAMFSICTIPNDEQSEYGFDGIYYQFQESKHYSCLMLFESDRINDETIDYHLVISSKPFDKAPAMSSRMDLIYCQDRKSLIFDHCDRTIYEMKLENIDIITNSLNFVKLAKKPELMGYNDSSMSYIYNANKIFAMDGLFQFGYNHQNLVRQTLSEKLKCGIFDISKQEWKFGKDFECKMYDNQCLLQLGICKKNVYETNKIYIVCTNGNTATYDLIKNDWTLLFCDLDDEHTQFAYKPLVWMDGNPHVLYCGYYDLYQYFGYFDMRDDVRKWKINTEMEFVCNTLKPSSPILFL